MISTNNKAFSIEEAILTIPLLKEIIKAWQSNPNLGDNKELTVINVLVESIKRLYDKQIKREKLIRDRLGKSTGAMTVEEMNSRKIELDKGLERGVVIRAINAIMTRHYSHDKEFAAHKFSVIGEAILSLPVIQEIIQAYRNKIKLVDFSSVPDDGVKIMQMDDIEKIIWTLEHNSRIREETLRQESRGMTIERELLGKKSIVLDALLTEKIRERLQEQGISSIHFFKGFSFAFFAIKSDEGICVVGNPEIQYYIKA